MGLEQTIRTITGALILGAGIAGAAYAAKGKSETYKVVCGYGSNCDKAGEAAVCDCEHKYKGKVGNYYPCSETEEGKYKACVECIIK